MIRVSFAKFKLIVISTIGLPACQTLTAEADVAAVITSPTEDSRAALQQAVNKALKTDVLLADNALTETSLLIVEHNPPGSIDAPQAQGRIMDMPVQFRLVMNGRDCILVDTRDESRHILANTTCVAEGT